MTLAASTSARLPHRWPCRSFTDLKPSRSRNSSDSGRPLRDARFDSRRSTWFRYRELYRLVRSSVTERSSTRRRCSVVSSASAGPSSTMRSADSTSGVSSGASDDGAESSTISAPIVRARQRSGNPATATAGPSVSRWSVARFALMNSSLCSVIHRATRTSPSRKASHGPRSAISDARCGPSCTATTRHAAGNHPCTWASQCVGHLARVDRGIDGPDQLNERVAAIQPLLQTSRRVAKTSGQICLSAAGGGWIGARCSRHLREKANSR